MTAVHNQPHPLAQKYVKPSNPQIAKKFGIVRVEDWDDRVSNRTWIERNMQGGFPEVDAYTATTHLPGLTATPVDAQVVRCHTQSTGETVLLHSDWLEGAQVIA